MAQFFSSAFSMPRKAAALAVPDGAVVERVRTSSGHILVMEEKCTVFLRSGSEAAIGWDSDRLASSLLANQKLSQPRTTAWEPPVVGDHGKWQTSLPAEPKYIHRNSCTAKYRQVLGLLARSHHLLGRLSCELAREEVRDKGYT